MVNLKSVGRTRGSHISSFHQWRGGFCGVRFVADFGWSSSLTTFPLLSCAKTFPVGPDNIGRIFYISIFLLVASALSKGRRLFRCWFRSCSFGGRSWEGVPHTWLNDGAVLEQRLEQLLTVQVFARVNANFLRLPHNAHRVLSSIMDPRESATHFQHVSEIILQIFPVFNATSSTIPP